MKVLHITSSLDGGGIARLLLDYCSRMLPFIEVDFAITSETNGILEEKLKRMGCNIYHIPQLRKKPITYIRVLKKIMRDGNYDIVHAHGDYKNFMSMLIAKMIGIKCRIIHSHLAYVTETKKQIFERKILTPVVKTLSTQLMACSKDSAIWTWGPNSFFSGKVKIMTNAIDTKKFIFNKEKRERIRKLYKLENSFVVGNVARFSYQKNHKLLIEIFAEIQKKRENAKLVLIGDGELKNDIIKQIKKLNLSDKVILLGTLDNVNEYLNMMDVFVLPTRFEGLGIVYIEAQANGLKCFATEKVVPKEVNICNNICFISKDNARDWASEILNHDITRDQNVYRKILDAGYDIDKAALDMREFYISLWKK